MICIFEQHHSLINSTRGLKHHTIVTADSKRRDSTPVRYDWLRLFQIWLRKALPTLRKSC
jgi:hypothetical protein